MLTQNLCVRSVSGFTEPLGDWRRVSITEHRKDWFIAGINAEKRRTVTFVLDFLKAGAYEVKLYRDGQNAKVIAVEEMVIDTQKPFKI